MHTTFSSMQWLFHPPSDFETATYEQRHVPYRHRGPATTIDRDLPFPPHRIPRHREIEKSTFIPRSKIRSRKGHVERSKDQKTNGWR